MAARKLRPPYPRRESDPDAAIDRLSNQVNDRFGGTKIGAGLGELVSSPIWSNTVRGVVVVVASDGWDADSPDVLERHNATPQTYGSQDHWVNPRTAAADFEPLVGSLAAALPYTDQMLSGHTLNAMRDVITSVRPPRR